MRRLLAVVSAFALCATLGCGHGRPSSQDNFSKVEVQTLKVAGNVYMIVGSGGNIGVSAGADGVLIVDDQFAPLAEKIRAAFKPLGTGRLRYVLNTHFHFDHTGSNVVFGTEAPIVAHANVRRRLVSGAHVLGRDFKPSPPEALPVITYETTVSVYFNGEEVRVVHLPSGHTDGDSVIFFTASNVIHMGDDFFAGRFPFVDIDNGGSVEGLERNVSEIIEKAPADVKIIPGHGPLSTLADLRAFRDMLRETTSIVRERVRAGRTLEEAKAEGLPDSWKQWGEGFVKTGDWIEIVYKSLKQNAGKTARFRRETRDAAARLSCVGGRPADWHELTESLGG